MRSRHHYPWEMHSLFSGRPSVGRLMDLCDENYRHFLRLAPEVRDLTGCHASRIDGLLDLHMEIQEQTPYTTLVHLTYFFKLQQGQQPDPDALLRIYHDSRQVEVIELRETMLPLNTGRQPATLRQKWRVNLFLSKWLSYCLRQGHMFHRGSRLVSLGDIHSVAESC